LKGGGDDACWIFVSRMATELVIKDLYIAHLVIASKKAGSLTWLFSLLDCRKVEFAPCILGFSSFVG
jgi:hypothetical protein